MTNSKHLLDQVVLLYPGCKDTMDVEYIYEEDGQLHGTAVYGEERIPVVKLFKEDEVWYRDIGEFLR